MLLFSHELRLAYKLEHESATTNTHLYKIQSKWPDPHSCWQGWQGQQIQEIELIRSPENPRNMATIANKLIVDEI
jgi:hypothetical protein